MEYSCHGIQLSLDTVDPFMCPTYHADWPGKWKVILSMGMQLTWPCGRALAVAVSYSLPNWTTIFQVIGY